MTNALTDREEKTQKEQIGSSCSPQNAGPDLPQASRTDLDRLNFRENWQHQYVLGIKLITPRVKIRYVTSVLGREKYGKGFWREPDPEREQER